MRAVRTDVVVGAVAVLAALAAGCEGPVADPDEDPTPLPRTATVYETRDEACEDLLLRIDAGEVEPAEVELLDEDSNPTAARTEISDQLSTNDDVVSTGVTRCGTWTVVSVGVSTPGASVPEDIGGVPLMVYIQTPIETF